MNGKTVAGITSIGALAAAALAWQQIGDVLVLRDEHDLEHAAWSTKQQTINIDTQIIQAETQLEFLLDRKARGQAQPGDDARIQRLIDRIKQLETARDNLLRK